LEPPFESVGVPLRIYNLRLCNPPQPRPLRDAEQRERLALQLGELDLEDLHDLAVFNQRVPLGEVNRRRICSVVGRAH
jgi:hypothetical protein